MNNKIDKAKKLFNEFSGHDLNDDEFLLEIPDDLVIFPVGRLDGVLYTPLRDGKSEQYLHKFRKNSAPTLCMTAEGDQMFVIGGNYKFKDSGINDT